MGKNYQLKYVDEEVWEQTPSEIQEKKKRFNTLQHRIKVRIGSIDRKKVEIKKTQSELSEWKKERNKLLQELQMFQEKIIPSISPYQSKINGYQWSINITLGGVKKTRYLGSNLKVRERLDEIKDLTLFSKDLYNLEDECKSGIRKIIQRNLIDDIEKDFDGMINKLKENKLKMWDYFY